MFAFATIIAEDRRRTTPRSHARVPASLGCTIGRNVSANVTGCGLDCEERWLTIGSLAFGWRQAPTHGRRTSHLVMTRVAMVLLRRTATASMWGRRIWATKDFATLL